MSSMQASAKLWVLRSEEVDTKNVEVTAGVMSSERYLLQDVGILRSGVLLGLLVSTQSMFFFSNCPQSIGILLGRLRRQHCWINVPTRHRVDSSGAYVYVYAARENGIRIKARPCSTYAWCAPN